jgi:hypothetical protein
VARSEPLSNGARIEDLERALGVAFPTATAFGDYKGTGRFYGAKGVRIG